MSDQPNPFLVDIIEAAWREDEEALADLFTRLSEADRLRLGRLIKTIAAASIRHAHKTRRTLPGEVVGVAVEHSVKDPFTGRMSNVMRI